MNIAFFADINDNHNQKWIEQIAQYHSVIVFCEQHNKIKNESFLTKTNIQLYTILPSTFSIKHIFFKDTVVEQIKTILTEKNIHIIHSIYAIPYSLWAGLVENHNHIITTYGSDMLIDYKQNWKNPTSLKQSISFYLLRRAIRKTFNKAQIISATSTEQLNVIREFTKDHSKLYITRTGVDCERFENSFNKSIRNSKEFVLLSNRAMRPLYNIDMIVDAFVLLKKSTQSQIFKLVLLNYNTDEHYLELIKNKIESNNLKSEIEIINDLPFDDLVQCYKNSDIVIMIPKSDGTPVSGVETLVSKKPLIMGALKYDSDLFNSDTIWQLENNSAESLCQKIIEILNCPIEIINNKTEIGYTVAIKNASLKSEITKIEQFYQTIQTKNEH
jgi:glycosyltransferase involved in cell wall biosynthesis